MIYTLFLLLFFAVESVYFKIADHYNIIDHPNERSSHTRITIRGGGVIFLLAAICVTIMHPGYWLAVLGILVVGIISFVDDVHTLSSGIRLLVHFVAVTIMFFYLGVFHTIAFYILPLLYIMVIGIVNMYNFMDGINGITGAYSLVVLAGLQYVNLERIAFVDPDMIWIPILAGVTFLFFNFRKKARCFAGDVGSVTLAFWITMLLLRLIFKTTNWTYILFLVVYGVDSILTIVHRLMRGENILKAHRFHFYQILVNERKVPHLVVSSCYALIQGGVVVAIIANPKMSLIAFFVVIAVPLAAAYVLFKPKLIK